MLAHIFLILFTTIFAIVCLLLILVVLMQRSKQDGIGAAFGSGITDSMFGAQTSSVLVKFTSWLTVLFFVLSIVLAQFHSGKPNHSSTVLQQLNAAAPPAAAPVAAPAPVTSPTPIAQPAPAQSPTPAQAAHPASPSPTKPK